MELNKMELIELLTWIEELKHLKSELLRSEHGTPLITKLRAQLTAFNDPPDDLQVSEA